MANVVLIERKKLQENWGAIKNVNFVLFPISVLCYAIALLVFAVAKDEEESNIFTGYKLYWGFFLGKLQM